MPRVLVIGAAGRIGSPLLGDLRQRYGRDQVVAGVWRRPTGSHGPEIELDVLDGLWLEEIIRRWGIEVVYQLAALSGADADGDPDLAWRVNVDGLRNVLEASRKTGVISVFWPSSIAAFGPESPRTQTPQITIMRPWTLSGITKLSGELVAEHYYRRYHLDVRGIRYPGVVGPRIVPVGDTTDYAVEMCHSVIDSGEYQCYLRADTELPMLYVSDCVRAAIELMETPGEFLAHRFYNLAGVTFSPQELATELRGYRSGFHCTYVPDERQAVADSWPSGLDERAAHDDWGWRAEHDLSSLAHEMVTALVRPRATFAGERARSARPPPLPTPARSEIH